MEQIFNSEQIRNNLDILWFYLPLGIIGIWRWSIWLFKKIVAMFYRMPKGNYDATLSIVTPVYNEDPIMFRKALESWKANEPLEIIAVIDFSDQQSIEIFQDFAKSFGGAKMIVTEKPGKRPALADGVKESIGEIVALIDSDTIWTPNIKSQLLGPFEDPTVGGVGPRQDVLVTDTVARKLFKIHMDSRYFNELPALAVLSDSLTCLSGRTAVYRRSAIIDLVDEMVNETFLGKQSISGDDKALTHLVQKHGWKTRYLKDIKVYTPGFPDLATYFQQQERWTRNSWRADAKSLCQAWAWKGNNIWLALYMLDRFVQPFTLLLGPIYFGISLYYQQWFMALMLLLWWNISRAIKIFPHLREKKGDIFFLPAYIVSTYFIAIIKIYTLLSIDKQGWITRWNKNRLAKFKFLYELPTYAAAVSIIVGMTFVFANIKGTEMHKYLLNQKRKQIVQAKKNREDEVLKKVTSGPRKKSVEEVEQQRTALLQEIEDNKFGYLEYKMTDSFGKLKTRYNLSSVNSLLTENHAPIVSPFRVKAGSILSIPVDELQKPLDKTVLRQSQIIPDITYDAGSNTIFVEKAGSVVNLSRIKQKMDLLQKGMLQNNPQTKEWILRSRLAIGPEVTLVIDGDEVSHLKLTSKPDDFVWIRSHSGNILIDNTKITSWDETQNDFDREYKDGRSYITSKASGRMDVLNSEIAYLGFPGFEQRGGDFGGSYGLSWKLVGGRFGRELLTGVVENNRIHHNYFGIYTYGVTGMLVRGNETYQNDQYGIDPHDDSNNMLIENNKSHDNGNHGIITSKRCFHNIIQNNISYGNRLHGIMLDKKSNNNLVQNNKLFNNVDGVAIYDSHRNVIINNESFANKQGIRINVESSDNHVFQNQLYANRKGIFVYAGAKENYLINNDVKENDIGISLWNTANNYFYDNDYLGANKRDNHLFADAYDNEIK